jgi:hypothetical protein
MSRIPNPERIRKLEQQAERIARQLRQARAVEAKQSRADDSRRKIIGGALCETHALKNPQSDFAKTHVGLLKQYVRPEDRWLFADTFCALLPPGEAATLLSQGEIAREAAAKAKAHKRAIRRPIPEAAE